MPCKLSCFFSSPLRCHHSAIGNKLFFFYYYKDFFCAKARSVANPPHSGQNRAPRSLPGCCRPHLQKNKGEEVCSVVVGVALLVWLFSSLGPRNIYGVVQGRGRGHQKEKGVFLSGKKKEGISEGEKKVFFWERGMGALFRKRCLDNARGIFSRRLSCTQVVTCKVAAILIKKVCFEPGLKIIFEGGKRQKKSLSQRFISRDKKKSTEKTFYFPEK